MLHSMHDLLSLIWVPHSAMGESKDNLPLTTPLKKMSLLSKQVLTSNNHSWRVLLGPILCRSCSEFMSTTSMSFPEDVFFHHIFPSSGFYILHPLPFWNVLWPLRMGSILRNHLVLTLWAAIGFSLNGHSPQQYEASLVKTGCLSQSLINRQWEQVLKMLVFLFQMDNSKIHATLFLRVAPVTLNPNFSNMWLALAYSVGLASSLPVLHIFLKRFLY